jgi:hypothetical protein
VKEEEELIRIQQKIKRLCQDQESIMRRQAAAQRAKARRKHINRERARLTELQCSVDILFELKQEGNSPTILLVTKEKEKGYVQGIYKGNSHEAMSSARLGLALCLHNKKRSLKSFFHLTKEIYTMLKMRLLR